MKGSIFEYRPGRFCIRMYCKGEIRIYRDDHGELLDSRLRAERMLSHIRYEIDTKQFNPNKYRSSTLYTFSEAFADYLKGKSEGYRKVIGNVYKNHFKKAFGSKDFREIHTIEIQNFYQTIAHLKTAAGYMAMLRAALRWMYHSRDVQKVMPYFERVPWPKPRDRYLTAEQQQLVLDNIDQHYRPIVSFCMAYGCRPIEARKLTWAQITKDTVTIHHTKTKTTTVLPMIPAMKEMLDKLPRSIGGLVFTTKTGNEISRSYLEQVWKEALIMAGLEHLTYYEGTRHSFASQKVQEGFSLAIVGKIMGHTSYKNTERYAKVNTKAFENVLPMRRENDNKGE